MRDQKENDYEVGFVLASPTDRLLACLIDVLIVAGLTLTVIGSILGLAYFLTKDSLPIYEGQSLGKRLLKLKVLDNETNLPIKNDYMKSFLRNIPLIIPVFQFIDAFMVFSTNGKRFGDQWANTMVVKDI